MTTLRLAMAQLDACVGDLAGNAALVRQAARDALTARADLLACPEMMLTGYPIEDLALRHSFQDATEATLVQLAADLAGVDGCGELPVLVGTLYRAPHVAAGLGVPRGAPQNVLAVLHRGQVVTRYAKHHLPNYGVFDEIRYFVPGTTPTVLRVGGIDVALAICEDLWRDGGPVAWARDANAGLLVVVNGSPYEREKDDVRAELCRTRAREAGCTLAYVNLVGGQDELVFDGDSLVMSASGEVLARAPQFVPDLLVVDLELPAAAGPVGPATVDLSTAISGPEQAAREPMPARQLTPHLSDTSEVWGALVCGLGGYIRKNGFKSVVLGLSGGIDSAVVAAIACDTVGAHNVYAVSLPSDYSSAHSRSDAAELAERTGLNFRTVPIAPMVDAFVSSLALTGLAEENVQARVRGTTLMAISNAEGHLVLATGNKSELSVGYSTIYGDAVGGFDPIKDCPKVLVWQLARWRNEFALENGEIPPIPEASITKPPSAELRPGQFDADSLPDYQLLDDVLDDYVGHDRSGAELLAAGFERSVVEKVLKLTDAAEWKRRQYPPGPKISVKNFGRDRRLPITNRFRESVD